MDFSNPFLALPGSLQLVFGTALGLLVGSFGNSVVHRLPRKLSAAGPVSVDEKLDAKRSHCPRCKSLIAWYDNIPVFSWLRLRGRCRHCAVPIPARYVVLEALGAALGLATTAAYGLSIQALLVAVAGFLVKWAATIDSEHGFIPRRLVGALAGTGVVLGCWASAWWAPLAGMATAAAVLFAAAWVLAWFQTLGRQPWQVKAPGELSWRVLLEGAAPLVVAMGAVLGAQGVVQALVIAGLWSALATWAKDASGGMLRARWGVPLAVGAAATLLRQAFLG